MKKLIVILLCLYTFNGNAQKANAKILSSAEVSTLFDDGLKTNNNISYPIFKAYQYINNKQLCYLLLTESIDDIKGKDSSSKNIKAFLFEDKTGDLKKELDISDNINPALNEEYSISFWTKYLSFEKDGNKMIPIIVYGTKGMNNYMDGRMKIVIVYNNQKIVIRHQNAVLDGERLTKIDKAFYSLPAAIQKAVRSKIFKMEKDDNVILGYDWEKEMSKKKLEIKG